MKRKLLLIMCLCLCCFLPTFAQRDTLRATFVGISACYGPALLRIDATGGYKPYQYSIDGINYQSDNFFTFPNIGPEDSLVGKAFVRDSLGAVFSGSFLIPTSTSNQYYYGTVNCGSDYVLKTPFFGGIVLHNVTKDTVISYYQDIKCFRIIYHESVHVVPFVNRFDTIEVCAGSNFTFPDRTHVSNVLSSIAHTSRFTFPNGCDSIINTYLHVNYKTEFVADTICPGSSYTFPDGSVLDSITKDVSYTSIVRLPDSCLSRTTTYLQVVPLDPSVTVSGHVLLSNQNYGTYQWGSCGQDSASFLPIPGATTNRFQPLNEGYYALSVSRYGCSATSDCISVLVTDVEDQHNLEVVLFPNPAKEQVSIQFPQGSGEIHMEVYNSVGSKIKVADYNNIAGTNIEMSQQAPGLYFVKLQRGSAFQVLEFIKE